MIITSYSDWNKPLDECPKNLKGKGQHRWLLNNLRRRNRISCWEIDTNWRVCRSLMYLKRIGKIKLNGKAYDYPYVGVSVKGSYI